MRVKHLSQAASGLAIVCALTSAGIAAPISSVISATSQQQTVQYYPNNSRQWGYPNQWQYNREQRMQQRDPTFVCREHGGNLWRMPSKDFRPLDVRPARNGNVVVRLSVHGRIAFCTVDRWGNLIDFR